MTLPSLKTKLGQLRHSIYELEEALIKEFDKNKVSQKIDINPTLLEGILKKGNLFVIQNSVVNITKIVVDIGNLKLEIEKIIKEANETLPVELEEDSIEEKRDEYIQHIIDKEINWHKEEATIKEVMSKRIYEKYWNYEIAGSKIGVSSDFVWRWNRNKKKGGGEK